MPNATQKSYPLSWILLLAFLTALGPLSIDMYLPALPQMAQDFHTTAQKVANSLPAYFLGLAMGQLIYGPISDRIGRKKPLYFGLILYILGGLLCIYANSAWALIFSRVIQALGGCVGVVIARAAIRDRLDVEGSAQAFSSMMIVMGIAPVIAPTLGAAVLAFYPWQAIFKVLAFIGLIGLCSVHFFFKETLAVEKRLHLNVQQVFLLYGRIFADRQFVLPMLCGCLGGGALFIYISSATAILMGQYHLSQQHFAYVFGLNAFGISLMSYINKHHLSKFSIVQRLLLGGMMQFIGVICLLVAGMVASFPLWGVMIGMFIVVSSIGLSGPNAMALAMAEQGARAGTASAIMGSMQFMVGLFGGVLLNFLVWDSLLNMAVAMLLCSSLALIATFGTMKNTLAE
ncbi:multidrug effflux MFS transporter [Acinetobacter sp. MD2(2019)]|uniref:multidrug effflux MFS transporter n=1 Tax=Acinetobacter sp. MD2(2019) TaxID=2605273 RepID=UPI002D1ED23E|nr:multidrug effflux MFS transporter [Acinetobacter sp. MD2(2019)]MEB3753972.1 multidrug effflux MFS transporter [Acinetobacter sp. MD2(2019)]